MENGNIITIYEDPVTMQKIEGKAKLLKQLHCNDPSLEYWTVLFINDLAVVDRYVKPCN